MTPSKLRELAENASSKAWTLNPRDWSINGGNMEIATASNYQKDARFIASADPTTILKLLNDRSELINAMESMPCMCTPSSTCLSCHTLENSKKRWSE